MAFDRFVGNAFAAVSPHKIGICILIKLYTKSSTTGATEATPCTVDELSQAATKEFSKFLHAQIHRTERAVEITALSELLGALEEAVRGEAGKKLSNCLEQSMLIACNSPNDLLELVMSFETNSLSTGRNMFTADDNMFEDTRLRPEKIGRDSYFGLFLRRVVLSIEAGHFVALSLLYDQLVTYITENPIGTEPDSSLFFHPGSNLSFSSKRACKDSQLARPVVAMKICRFFSLNAASPSQFQLNMHLQDAIMRLENNFGKLSFTAIEEYTKELLRLDPDLPRAYWIRFLNCSFHRNQQSAMAALHRYFDYALRVGGPNSSTGEIRSRGNNVNDITMFSFDTLRYCDMTRIQDRVAQYSVLNKACLHYHFGQYAYAAAAAEESIRLAQENGNGHAISLALAWLYQVLAAQRDPNAIQVLRRCVNACAEWDIDTRLLDILNALNFAKALTSTPSLPGCGVPQFHLSLQGQVWSSLATAASAVSNALASSNNLTFGNNFISSGGNYRSRGRGRIDCIHLSEHVSRLHSHRQLLLSAICAQTGQVQLAAFGAVALLQSCILPIRVTDIPLAIARLTRIQVLFSSSRFYYIVQ